MRPGKVWLRFGAAALAAAILIGCGAGGGRNRPATRAADAPDAPGAVKLLAGAGLRVAVDKLAAAFEAETGIRVEPDYGGSGQIIARVKLGTEADLFLPGDVGYVDKLGEKVSERTTISWFVPTIIVAKGNPKGVRGLADLLRKDLAVGLGDPRACRIGKVDELIFAKNKMDRDAIGANDPMLASTVNLLGVWVETKRVDVAIVWGAIAHNHADGVDRIEIPADRNVISTVVVGLLADSKRTKAARKFMAFAAGAKGQAILKANGYRTEAP